MEKETDYGREILNLIRKEKRGERTGWSTDMESAPIDKWLLLQSGTDETRIYFGQLQRLEDGSLQRKESRTFWKEDDNEMFFRDSIVAWFDAAHIIDFLHEAHRAVLLSRGPVISCSRINSDGSMSIAYKKGTVPEYRRFIKLGP